MRRGRTGDVTGTDDPDANERLIAALERARNRQPWTVTAIEERAGDPEAVKATAETCATCPAPCESDEICQTVVAHELELLDAMGRDQVFHLLDGGMRRLRLRDRIRVRRTDDSRPNTFIAIRDTDTQDTTAHE